MNMLRHIALLLLMACWARPAQGQTTWHVDDDCAPPGSGTEVDPFCTIQDGVNSAVDGDTVLVGAGTYTGDGNRDISLFGKTITVIAIDGPDATTIDIEGNPQSIHRGFFLDHGETRETLIEGFTITGGNLIGDTGGSGPSGGGGGAGIYLGASSPTIRDCVVVGNISRTVWNPFVHDGRGGGILLDRESSALIENCVILGNEADRQGGGMLHIGGEGTTAAVRNSLFAFNIAEQGGGIYNAAPANVGNIIDYDNNTIVNNFASFSGGGFKNGHSHGIIRNTIIWGNDSNLGAQIYVTGSLFTIEYSMLQGGEQSIEGPGDFEWGAGMIDATSRNSPRPILVAALRFC